MVSVAKVVDELKTSYLLYNHVLSGTITATGQVQYFSGTININEPGLYIVQAYVCPAGPSGNTLNRFDIYRNTSLDVFSYTERNLVAITKLSNANLPITFRAGGMISAGGSSFTCVGDSRACSIIAVRFSKR